MGKTKFCSLLEKNRHLEEKIQVFFNSEATIGQVARAGETFLIHLYGGNLRTSACDLNHLRYTLFTQSATKARSTLARLPPTVDAARFHSLRSYLQIQDMRKILLSGAGYLPDSASPHAKWKGVQLLNPS
ncbi:hypothetical protein AVEN_93958-1 [Araneus ventricosus]|uniref:Uncharacterized protein n=1 Tax=Araneus ventricosus TaxID=182803 RepID=A0A4Y2CKV2_ARAVE|nr:hypothetical protein AVEN_93958-1 [Araneus ventricosus]